MSNEPINFGGDDEGSVIRQVVDLVKDMPFEPDLEFVDDQGPDPTDTCLYRTVCELVAMAVERGCRLETVVAFIRMDLQYLA